MEPKKPITIAVFSLPIIMPAENPDITGPSTGKVPIAAFTIMEIKKGTVIMLTFSTI
jgi:hypothetical protein